MSGGSVKFRCAFSKGSADAEWRLRRSAAERVSRWSREIREAPTTPQRAPSPPWISGWSAMLKPASPPDRRRHEIAGVVVGHPGSENHSASTSSECAATSQRLDELRGERGVGLVEVLHRPAHGVSGQQSPQGVAEDVHPFPLFGACEGGGPGPVDVPDHGQGAAVGMAEQPLGKPRDERVGGDPPSGLPSTSLFRVVTPGVPPL